MATNELEKEVDRMDEETAPKAAADKSAVAGSNPVTSVRKGRKFKEGYDYIPEPPPIVKNNPEILPEVVERVMERYHDVIVQLTDEPKVVRYKLNLRKANGTIRADISKSVIYTLKVRWPDLLQVIPSERWVTVEEIQMLVSRWENTIPRKTIQRKPETIKVGLNELIEAGVLLQE